MQERIHASREDLQGDQVWVTHAGVMKLVYAHCLHMPDAEWLALRFAPGSVSCLEYAPGQERLLWHNGEHV